MRRGFIAQVTNIFAGPLQGLPNSGPIMPFKKFGGHSGRPKVPRVPEKIILNVRRRKDEREGSGDRLLFIYRGDITEFEGDAIVNAANTNMLGGGGVDGAIHDAAGPRLREACRRYKPFRISSTSEARCPTGDAKVTPGFYLPAKWVIHTVGPIFDDSTQRKYQQSCDDLYLSYMNSLALADNLGCKTIAFPAISCGVYGFPVFEAAQIALHACMTSMGDIREAHFILFASDVHEAFIKAAQECIDAKVVTLVPSDDVPGDIASKASDAPAKSTLDSPDASPMETLDPFDASLSGKPTDDSPRKRPITSNADAESVVQEGRTSHLERPSGPQNLSSDCMKPGDMSRCTPDAPQPPTQVPMDIGCSSAGQDDNSRGTGEVVELAGATEESLAGGEAKVPMEIASAAEESVAGEEATILTKADAEAEVKASATEGFGGAQMQTDGPTDWTMISHM